MPFGSKAKQHKRKIKYIEKDFQRNFIVKFCLAGVLAMALASAILYLSAQDTVTASYYDSRLSIETTADAIVPQLLATNIAVLVSLILITVFIALYVSFRIAGPLYRFSQDMLYIGEGNLSKRIRLRKGDQLEKFAGDINQMTENLETRVRKIQRLACELDDIANNEAEVPPEVKEKIDKLNTLCNTLFDSASK